MTTLETMPEIGMTLRRTFAGLDVFVTVVDVKYCYGQKRYQVEVFGQKTNRVWINAEIY